MNFTKHIEGVICVTDGNFPPNSFVFSGPRLPEVGEEINVKMNGLGKAVVEGYKPYVGDTTVLDKDLRGVLEQTMYVAVVCRFLNPPDWYIRQTGSKDALGPVFGYEIDWGS